MEKEKLKKSTEKKQRAIICDLDGTLCLLNGRNPYDASTCEDDVLNSAVGLIVKQYQSKVVFVSGRFEWFRPNTMRWLNKNDFSNYGLYMRPNGDVRKDYVLKKEIYETYLKSKYDIDFVLEDRNRNVKMWRNLGLVCLQVAEGNF